jgi:NAD(P)-dependent dehydrogenase (short-subunit alcohol dehydrogenase family)
VEEILFVGGTGGLVTGIIKSASLDGFSIYRTTRSRKQALLKDYLYFDVNHELDPDFKKILQKVDHIIFNIGSGEMFSGEKFMRDDWIKSFEINVFYIVDVLNELTKGNLNNLKTITFISSIAMRRIVGAPIYYAASKSSVQQIMKHLVIELAPSVRVNSIELGNLMHESSVWHSKQKDDKSRVESHITENVPMANFVTPPQVALVLKLILEKSMISLSGSTITLDGAQSIA